jgi:hypothetical protein
MNTADSLLRCLVPVMLCLGTLCAWLHFEGVRFSREQGLQWMIPPDPLEVIVQGEIVFVGPRADFELFRGDDGLCQVVVVGRGWRGPALQSYEGRDVVIRVRQ